MRLQEIMTRAVISVPRTLDAELAFTRMQAARVRHLVVLDGARISGIVSERDLGGARGTRLRRDRRVDELMTPFAVTAKPTTTVREAANLLRGHIVGCLPVVDGKKLVGIVTTTDLLDLLGRGAVKATAKGERPVLKGRGPRRRAPELVAARD